VDLDAIAPDRALLLGRIQVTILGDDRTGDTFILTNASEDEALLRPDGEVGLSPARDDGTFASFGSCRPARPSFCLGDRFSRPQ
jgi:hypothetical protein